MGCTNSSSRTTTQREHDKEEKTHVIDLLTDNHKMMNVSQINDLLHFVHTDNTKTQLLSFLFDAYGLIRYNQLLDNNLVFKNMSQFAQNYPSFQQQIVDQYDIKYNAADIYDLFNNAYDQYCASFGKPMTLNPKIKIKDSIHIFMNYIFGMNVAIAKYIDPQSPQCPLMIDFWIVPNRTVMIVDDDDNQQGIDNNIGNIKQRLDQNKVTYIKKKTNAHDIEAFANQIEKCLFSKKIKAAMEKELLSWHPPINSYQYDKESACLRLYARDVKSFFIEIIKTH